MSHLMMICTQFRALNFERQIPLNRSQKFRSPANSNRAPSKLFTSYQTPAGNTGPSYASWWTCNRPPITPSYWTKWENFRWFGTLSMQSCRGSCHKGKVFGVLNCCSNIMTQDFVPHLMDHILGRIGTLGSLVENSAHHDQGQHFFKLNRIYHHNLVRLNYMTYNI